MPQNACTPVDGPKTNVVPQSRPAIEGEELGTRKTEPLEARQRGEGARRNREQVENLHNTSNGNSQ